MIIYVCIIYVCVSQHNISASVQSYNVTTYICNIGGDTDGKN